MFLIDKVTVNGVLVARERPVCSECCRPFDASPKEIAQFRLESPRTIIVCRQCIIRECGMPVTRRKHQGKRAIAI